MVFTPVLLRCTTPLSLQPLWFGPRQWTIERGEGRYILLLYYLHTENISKYFVSLFSMRKFLLFISFGPPPSFKLLTMPASQTRGPGNQLFHKRYSLANSSARGDGGGTRSKPDC